METRMSPGILGTYTQLAAYTARWGRRLARRTAHRAAARCYCGTCQR